MRSHPCHIRSELVTLDKQRRLSISPPCRIGFGAAASDVARPFQTYGGVMLAAAVPHRPAFLAESAAVMCGWYLYFFFWMVRQVFCGDILNSSVSGNVGLVRAA